MLDDLKNLLRQEPFVPFRVLLANGSGYDVQSPYQVAIDRTQIDYYYPRSDRKAILPQNQVAAIEVMEPAS
jgi:hypothetical protein